MLAEHTPLALDILTDMLRGSLFDTDEMEREKRVVLEEIKMYEDSPEDRIHEIFESTLWSTHPLGKAIIGSDKTVSGLTRDNIVDYIAECYRPDRIVLSAAGNIPHDELVQMASDALGDMEGKAPVRKQPRGEYAQSCRYRRRGEGENEPHVRRGRKI